MIKTMLEVDTKKILADFNLYKFHVTKKNQAYTIKF